METGVILSIISYAILAIVGYFLKRALERIDHLEERSMKNEVTVSVLENDHKNKYDHMIEKFDSLTKSIDTLTTKIDILNKELKNN